jgi:hypothetical protein
MNSMNHLRNSKLNIKYNYINFKSFLNDSFILANYVLLILMFLVYMVF